MAKALKTAALVVGAVALVATGIGAAAGVGIGLGLSTATLATIATVATVASVVGGVLTIAAGLTAGKPSAEATGSQEQFSADPDAGIPLVLGRTGTAGNIVFRRGFDTRDAGDNDRQAFVAGLSLGPVAAIEGMTVDKVPTFFGGTGAAIGAFAGFMWSMTQLGAMPEQSALGFGAGGTPPGWTAQHKLSGLAAASWMLRFDTKAKVYQNGVPAPMWTVRGALAYDPRKDSTYPGGSGPHRMADPANTAAYDAAIATWEWTENPYLLGLRWVHGYWQRDQSAAGSTYQRVMGMGAPSNGIDVAAFVEGANIAQANGWTVGGVIFSGDEKWASLKKILQAGMGEPLALGARISCLVNAPKVSLATITINDVIGEASVSATQPRRDRLNTVTPRYRLEANNWQLLPGAPISVAAHVAEDRGKRSKVLDYPFIQNTPQVATAVRYDIENAREFGPIVLPLKLVWMGYKPGDCVTANLPEVGLNGQPILLLNRDLDPGAGITTMTARSETPSKHAFALGQTATAPSTPGVSGPPLVPVPRDGTWTITETAISSGGVTMPALVVRGQVDATTIETVLFEYRKAATGLGIDQGWLGAGFEPAGSAGKAITGVESGTRYEVAVSYQRWGVTGARRIIGPVTTAVYQGVRGESGQSAYSVILSNEAVVLPADSNGNILSYSSAVTTAQIFFGATDVTSLFSTAYDQPTQQNPENLSVTGTYPTYQVTDGFDANEASAHFTFKFVGSGPHEGVILGKTITLTKSREAVDGTSPPLITLTGTNNVFVFSPENAALDAVTTLKASITNSADAPQWRLLREDGTVITDWLLAPAFAATGAATRHLDYFNIQIEEDNFAANLNYHGGNSLTYQVRLQGTQATDSFTVFKLRNAKDGANGTSALTGYLTNENHTVPADKNGNVISYDGANGYFKVLLGTTDVTGQCSFVGGASSNFNWTSILQTGFYESTQLLSETGWGELIATYTPTGQTITKRFTLTKARVGASGVSPALVTLVATGQACKFDASGNYVGPALKFTASHQNFTGNYAFKIVRVSDGELLAANTADGYGSGGTTYYTGSAGATLVMTPVAIRDIIINHGTITIVAYSDGQTVSDSVTIFKVQDGTNGTNGKDGTNGIGTKGDDGRTSYIHYAYANSGDGKIDFAIGSPNGRVWEGTYSDFVQADSADPTKYTWKQYKGPPFGMAARGAANIAGDQVIKSVASANAWDADAYSTVGYKNGATVTFKGAGGGSDGSMAGLNTDPTTDSSYASLDYAWYLQGDGNASIYESGNGIITPIIGYGAGTFKVDYDGRYVRYVYNDAVYRTVDIGPGFTFYFDSSIAIPGSRITAIDFKPYPVRAAAGVTLVADAAGTEIAGNSLRCTVSAGWGAGHAHTRSKAMQAARWRRGRSRQTLAMIATRWRACRRRRTMAPTTSRISTSQFIGIAQDR